MQSINQLLFRCNRLIDKEKSQALDPSRLSVPTATASWGQKASITLPLHLTTRTFRILTALTTSLERTQDLGTWLRWPHRPKPLPWWSRIVNSRQLITPKSRLRWVWMTTCTWCLAGGRGVAGATSSATLVLLVSLITQTELTALARHPSRNVSLPPSTESPSTNRLIAPPSATLLVVERVTPAMAEPSPRAKWGKSSSASSYRDRRFSNLAPLS